MNQEHNDTIPTPKASLLLMEDDLCKRESEITRDSSVGISSRVFYYYQHDSLDKGVPFKWEMQPGTPINPPPEEIIPPITPPPAFCSLGLPKPSISVVENSNKHSLIPANLKLWRWKNFRKRYFSRRSSQSMPREEYNNARDGDSNSCGEMERLEYEDYRSSSSSSSSSSSKDLRLIKVPPRLGFSGCPPWHARNNHTGFR